MKYLIHLALFYCGLVLSFLAQLLLILIIPPLGKVTNPFGRAVNEPVFLLLILAGFAVGRYCYQRIPSRLAFAIWIVPGIFLLYSAWSCIRRCHDTTPFGLRISDRDVGEANACMSCF